MAHQVSRMCICHSLQSPTFPNPLQVLAVFISDTIHQALITHSGQQQSLFFFTAFGLNNPLAYIYLVSDIGAPAQLGDLVW